MLKKELTSKDCVVWAHSDPDLWPLTTSLASVHPEPEVDVRIGVESRPAVFQKSYFFDRRLNASERKPGLTFPCDACALQEPLVMLGFHSVWRRRLEDNTEEDEWWFKEQLLLLMMMMMKGEEGVGLPGHLCRGFVAPSGFFLQTTWTCWILTGLGYKTIMNRVYFGINIIVLVSIINTMP